MPSLYRSRGVPQGAPSRALPRRSKEAEMEKQRASRWGPICSGVAVLASLPWC